jgi:hypothetical protein
LVRVVLSLRGSAGVFLFVARLNSNCSFTVALCGRGAMLAVGVFVLRRAIFGVVR